MIEYGRLVDSP